MKKLIALLSFTILFVLPLTASAQSEAEVDDRDFYIGLMISFVLILLFALFMLTKGKDQEEYQGLNKDKNTGASFNHPPLQTVSEDDVRAAGNSLTEKLHELIKLAKGWNVDLMQKDSFITLELKCSDAMKEIEQDKLPQSSELLEKILLKITTAEKSVIEYTEEFERRQKAPAFFDNGGYAEGKRFLSNPTKTIREIDKLLKNEDDDSVRRRLEHSRNAIQGYQDGSSSMNFLETLRMIYIYGLFDHTESMNIPQGNWNNDPNDVPEIQSDNEHIENNIADDPNLESSKIAEEASIGNEEVKDDSFEKDYEEVNKEETNEEIQNNDEETNDNDTTDTDSGGGGSSDD